MKKIGHIVLPIAAVGMAAAPVAAQSTVDRTSAPTESESELRGNGSSVILAILAVAAIIAGILIFASDNDDDAVSA